MKNCILSASFNNRLICRHKTIHAQVSQGKYKVHHPDVGFYDRKIVSQTCKGDTFQAVIA